MKLLLFAFISLPFMFATEWETFQSDEGNFQVEMPDLPAIETQVLSSKIGELFMHMYIHEGVEGVDENLIYMVNYTDYPEKVINSNMEEVALDNYFRGSIDGAVSNMEGTLVEEKKITVLGYQGREVVVNYLNGVAVVRMQTFLVNNRMYALQVITLAENDNNASQKRFFNSFELLQK
jgi:hypothetical protein